MKPVAVITGASRGIGAAIASLLAENGWHVRLLARDGQQLMKLAEKIHGQGFSADYKLCDVTDEQSIATALDDLSEINMLVCNAGAGVFAPVEQITAQQWQSLLQLNVMGTVFACQKSLPKLRKAGGGTIVAITSDVARRTFANGSAYCASKYAQDAFLQSLRKEVHVDNIRVANIMPGMTDTSFADSEQGADYKKDWLKAEDIAQAVLYAANAPLHVSIEDILLHPVCQLSDI